MKQAPLWFLLASLIYAQAPTTLESLHPLIGSGAKGDGGPATAAILDAPAGLAEDAAGNVYVAEANAGTIRRVRPDGVIERFAGTGIIGAGVDGLMALATGIGKPTALVVDRDGGLIYADEEVCRIRKVTPDGIVRNLIGTGVCGGASGGFPGPIGGTSARRALETQIATIGAMILDRQGRLLFSDESANVVRRLDPDGLVRTVAGSGAFGFAGDESFATGASFRTPRGLAIDEAANLYIADSSNCRVRKVDADGIVTTVAGTSSCSSSATFRGGSATSIPIGTVAGLAYHAASGSLLIGSPGLNRVIRLDLAGGRTTPWIGNGQLGPALSDVASEYPVDNPTSILTSSRGILIADRTGYAVIRVQGDQAAPFAGTWPQLASYSSAATASLLRPRGLCLQPDGSLVVVDAGAERVLVFRRPDQLRALAGSRSHAGYTSGDGGLAPQAQIADPRAVACAANGDVYLLQSNRLRVLEAFGLIRTLREALNEPAGIALDAEGRIFYSEAGLHRVVRFDPATRTQTVIAGTGTSGFSGDGGAATEASLNSPGDLALDGSGNLFVSDRGNRRIRRVSPLGIIQTIAGSSRSFSFLDISGQLATEVGLSRVEGIAIDQNGNVLFTEPTRLNAVTPDGRIHVLAGFLTENDAGLRTYRLQELQASDDLVLDRNGRLYLSQRDSGRVLIGTFAGAPPLPVEVPSIAEGGIISSGAFGGSAGAARGSWIEIFGSNLASNTRSWTSADFTGTQAPAALDSTRVTIGDRPAFVAYVSPAQVNVQVPSETPLGSQRITVSTPAGVSESRLIEIAEVKPGLLAPASFRLGGRQYAVATIGAGLTYAAPANAIQGTASRPARRGEVLTFYGIGFGDTTPRIRAGEVVAQSNTIDAPIEITIDGARAGILYAGLVPGSIGLYQINVVVPEVSSNEAATVVVSIGGQRLPQILHVAVVE
jgi:trimeric autotransporter adhesin